MYRIVHEDSVYRVLDEHGDETGKEASSLDDLWDEVVSGATGMTPEISGIYKAIEDYKGGGPAMSPADAITDAVAAAMSPEDAKAKPEPIELTEEQKRQIEENRKALIEENERIKEIQIATVSDAARIIRAGSMLMVEAGQRLVDSGLIGNVEPELQHYIKNMLEVEREYQAVIAGTATAKEAEAVPSILTDFLKRSELEAAEARAEKEREAEKARIAAAAAAKAASARVSPGYEDDEDEEVAVDSDGIPEERKQELEEEQKKIDEFFGGGIF